MAHPKIGEREVTQALLEHDHHLVRTGQVLLGDEGFAGAELETFTHELGMDLVRPDRKDETPRFGNLARHRQWIEAIFNTLKGQLTLESPSNSTPDWGVSLPPDSGPTGRILSLRRSVVARAARSLVVPRRSA